MNASFGVAQQLVDTESPEELIDLADQALLVAKRSGCDRVVGFQSLNSSTRMQSDGCAADTLFSDVLAMDAMTTIVASLNEDDLVGHAARYFLRFRINSAPVVDDAGKSAGIVAEKDVMAIMLGPNWWDKRIKEVMKKNVVFYDEQTPALAIYEFLCRVSIRSVIIVKDGRPTGVISRGSLLRWCTNSRSIRSLGTAWPEPAIDSRRRAGHEPSNSRLAKTARAIVQKAAHLEKRLLLDGSEIVPRVVVGSSRLQELVNDLLAHSRFEEDDERLDNHVESAVQSDTAGGSFELVR